MILYRGQVAVLVAPEGRLAPGMASVNVESLVNLMGARSVDIYLQPKVASKNHALVCATHSRFYLEIQGQAVMNPMEVQSSLADGKAQDPSQLAAIMVLVSGVPIDNPTERTIRKLAGQGRLAGVLVPVYNAVEATRGGWRPGRYKFLTLGAPSDVQTLEGGQHAVTLDSNVLLDLEAAYRGRVDPHSPLHKELHELAVALMGSEVLPAFGLIELCWSVPSKRRQQRMESLLTALDAWLGHGLAGAVEIGDLRSRSAATTLRPAERWEAGEFVGGDVWALIGTFVLPTYASLLKLNELWDRVSGFKARQRLQLLEEYVAWIGGELNIVAAYPLRVACDLLVGRDNSYVFKLLKFGRDRRRNLRGAAWDLYHLNHLDVLHFGDLLPLGGEVTPSLVTADGALLALRDRLSAQAVAGYGDRRATITQGQLNLHPGLREHRGRIAEVLQSLLYSRTQRLVSGHDVSSVDNLVRVCNGLEAQLSDGRFVPELSWFGQP